MSNHKLLQVVDWESNFEGAKTRLYNNKTTCQMPTKHGLGYKRLVRRENGAALFGAWCALIQVLSRHPKPRRGYCTDTGGIPQGYCEDTTVSKAKIYYPEDLEYLTDIPANLFAEIFKICQSEEIGWLKSVDFVPKDTTGIPRRYHAETMRIPWGSLNSDLDLDSNLDSDYNSSMSVDELRQIDKTNMSDEEKTEVVHYLECQREITLTNKTENQLRLFLGDVLRIPTAHRLASIRESTKRGWKDVKDITLKPGEQPPPEPTKPKNYDGGYNS